MDAVETERESTLKQRADSHDDILCNSGVKDVWKENLAQSESATMLKRCSLLEAALARVSNQNGSNRGPDNLWLIYEDLKNQAQTEWKKSDRSFFFHDNKGLDHSQRIIERIEEFIYPLDSEPESLLSLNKYEVFILLCAAVIHDFGKMFWKLSFSEAEILELGKSFADVHANDVSADLAALSLIEARHCRNVGLYLDCYLLNKANLLDPAANEYDLLELPAISDIQALSPDMLRIIKSLCVLHKNPEALTLRYQIEALSSAKHDAEIAHQDSSEISNGVKNAKNRLNAEVLSFCHTNLSGEDLNIDFETLLALLVLGDNLDVTSKRIDSVRMASLNVNNRKGSLSETKLKILAKWCLFAWLPAVSIRHDLNSRGTIEVKIILHYSVPASIDQYFLAVRKLTEKDFEKPYFLYVLEDRINKDASDKNYRIKLLYTHESRSDSISENIKSYYEMEDARLSAAVDHLACATYEWKAIDDTRTLALMPFSVEAPKELMLPRSYSTLDVLRQASRIKRSHVVAGGIGKPECWLEKMTSAGLLKKEEAGDLYTVSPAKEKLIDFVKEEYRKSPKFVKTKIEELNYCGNLLPFSLPREDGGTVAT